MTLQDVRIAVTAARKGQQFVDLLRARDADVIHGAMLRGDAPAADEVILADTETILAAKPGWLVASSGMGMGLWMEAADRGGLGEPLRELIGSTRCVARGAKSAGGIIRAGGRPVWTSPRETDADVAGWLEGRVLPDETIAVQLHGGVTHAYRHLSRLGVDLLTVMPYVSGPPEDDAPARELISALVAGEVDVITFTSPNAVRNLFTIAESMGDETITEVRRLLTGEVAVASIGPVTSDVIEGLGAVVTITPRRFRSLDLIRAIEGWATNRSATPADVAAASGFRLRPDTMSVEVDERSITLGPREYEILAMMLRSSGSVFKAEELVTRAWGHEAPDDPALVRHQVSRLRRKLHDTGVDIQTVRGLGYRLVAAG